MKDGPWTLYRVCPAITALFLSLVLPIAAGTSRAQSVSPPEPSDSVESLTQTLVTLSARYQTAGPAEQSQILNDLSEVAATRQRRLATLVQENPKEVLRVALPEAIRASLPPAAQVSVEGAVQVEGELEVLYEDHGDGEHNDDSQLRYFLKTGSERVPLHFATKPPRRLRTGAQVRVSGVRVGGALALESGSTSVETVSTALPATAGEERILVVLVNFQDNPIQLYMVNTARSIIFEDTSNFFLENSFQQTHLSGEVYGWYTLPLSRTVCDAFGIKNAANAAAATAGADLSAYSHFIYAFPQNACGFWGSGTVGGNPTYAWINGDLTVKVVGHEFGHNLGLYHSHALECDTVTLGSNCTEIEYGDTLDIMGKPSVLSHFNAFQKEKMGWLHTAGAPPITTVETSGTYLLDPYESMSAGPKALKILKSTDPATGKKTWYYVESRKAIGFDGFLAGNGNVLNGVVIRLGSESSANSSDLLDMTPAASPWWVDWDDPALVAGQSFSDPDTGVTILTLWANNTGAAVSVTFGPQTACTQANPTVGLSPSQSQWVKAGTTVRYTVSVTNNDTTGCPASGFTLQASVLDGWIAVFASPTLTLSPGANASTTLRVTSPASAADGFYPVGVEAMNSANPTYFAAPSATYAIASTLNMTVSSDRPSYTRGQWVSLAAQVSFAGSPVANARVTFTLRRPNGRVTTKSVLTGSDGVATVRFLLKAKSPVGTYEVTAKARQKRVVVGSATTSFTVE
ncbi:MAG: peptidase M11 [Deltaproteobacteria bacterium]|nr:peptidase M11 [Deltaproteobacteria bacterium]